MKNLLRIIFNKQEKGEKVEIPNNEEAADFESAITAAGFGKFNVFLIIVSIPMAWMSQFETSAMSYVFPAAQCDLSLSLGNKGMLNAITYAGAICSGFSWGILMDNMGRRKLMIICFLLDGLFTVLSSFSQSFTFLMIMKFFGGFIMNGPSAGMTAYLSEIHSEKFRSRVPLLLGFWNSLAAIYLPLLASFVMPLDLEMVIAEWLVFYPWSLYLLLNSLPATVSGLIFLLLPESPKYLMTAGKNDEALKVFQKIYSINTGKPVETYPIKLLVEEKVTQGSSSFSFREGFNQILSLFKAPFLKNLVFICFLQVFLIMGQNTLRLWTPQLFQSINDYKVYNNGSSSNLCEMLKYIQPSKNSSECVVITNNMEVYHNSMIVSGTTAGFYIIAGSLIGVLGQNRFLVIVSFFAGSFASAIYFAPNGEMATFLIALYSGFSSLATNGSFIVVVNLFPTALRTVAVSVGIMFGRISSMSGNIVFPYLLQMGCAPPFLFSACALFGGSIMATLLPKKNDNFI